MSKKSVEGYDIIGDVHGFHGDLEKLFEKLRLPQVIPSFKNAPWCKMNSKCETKLCKRKNGMCSADSRHF